MAILLFQRVVCVLAMDRGDELQLAPDIVRSHEDSRSYRPSVCSAGLRSNDGTCQFCHYCGKPPCMSHRG